MHKSWTSFLFIGGIMCLYKNLIYIKPTRNFNQLECYCSMVNSPMQSHQIPKANYTTTIVYTVDGNKHVQDDKHLYTKVFLLELSDKVHANHQYQCLPPITCQNIQQLGLHRRGKRRKMHLDIIRPLSKSKKPGLS